MSKTCCDALSKSKKRKAESEKGWKVERGGGN